MLSSRKLLTTFAFSAGFASALGCSSATMSNGTEAANPEMAGRIVDDAQGGQLVGEMDHVLRKSYEAMENKQSEAVLALYHPATNLVTSTQELDEFHDSIAQVGPVGHHGWQS